MMVVEVQATRSSVGDFVRQVRGVTVALWAPLENWRRNEVLHDQASCDT